MIIITPWHCGSVSLEELELKPPLLLTMCLFLRAAACCSAFSLASHVIIITPWHGGSVSLEELQLKSPTSFMMIGAPDEAMMLQASQIDDMPEIINDLDQDWQYDPSCEFAASAGASLPAPPALRPLPPSFSYTRTR